MGNQLRKEYQIEDTPCGSGGFGMHWKIYNATHLKTKQKVSIFILNKKSLPIRKNPYYDIFRRDISTATQCKHSDILRILSNDSSKLESNSQLAFVSERIIGSLANFINNDVDINKKQLNLGELRIKLGITQLLSAVEYLQSLKSTNNGNNDALHPMFHGFIDLCNIYVSTNGDWKLMGFSFTHDAFATIKNGETNMNFSFGSYRNEKNLAYLPPYTCLAPEIYLDSNIDEKSDVFSVCRVIYFVYLYYKNKLNSFPGCFLSTMSDYQLFLKDIEGTMKYESFIDDSSILHLLKIGLVKDLNKRGELKHLSKTEVTQNVNVKVIRYLDELQHKSTEKKLSFIGKLSQAVATFSYDIIKDKMIPNIIRELKGNKKDIQQLEVPILSLIFQLLHIHIEPIHFQTMVFPHIIQYFETNPAERTFQIMAKNIGILSKHCNKNQKALVAQLYSKCLDLRFAIAMQKLILTELATAVESDLFTKDILCRIILRSLCDICYEKSYNNHIQTLTSLRINVLICFSKICHKLSETEVVQFILEPIKYLVSVSTHSPAILMSSLGVYQCIVKAQMIAQDASYINVIALHLIPMMSPMYINPNLKPKQSKFCMRLMRQMLDCLQSYKQSKEDNGMMNSDIESPLVADANISVAKQVPHDEIAIMDIDIKQSQDPEVEEIEADEYSTSKQEDITPFPDKDLSSVVMTPGHFGDIEISPSDKYASKKVSKTFTYNQSRTAQSKLDDKQRNPAAAWTAFDDDHPIKPEEAKMDDEDAKQPDIFGKSTQGKDTDWTGFGHFSIDVAAWGAMSVDKNKFEDFDFGTFGDTQKKTVAAKESEVINENLETVTQDNNPFEIEHTDDDGADVNNADENPFSFSPMNSFDDDESTNKNVTFSSQNTENSNNTNTNNEAYNDPFKDLFG